MRPTRRSLFASLAVLVGVKLLPKAKGPTYKGIPLEYVRHLDEFETYALYKKIKAEKERALWEATWANGEEGLAEVPS